MSPILIIISVISACITIFLMYDYWRQYLMPGYKSFHYLYEQSFKDIYDVLNEQPFSWWLTEGTLIWSLRYGRNFPEELIDIVDDDIDVMLETHSHQQWMEMSEQIARNLKKKGWTGLNRRSTSNRENTRLDKMQIFFRKGIWVTHLDLHSYIVDEERNVAWSNGSEEDYPFQYWNGYVPMSLIRPFKTCLAFGRLLKCPAKPAELLCKWNSGEYADKHLRYPLRYTTREEKIIIDSYSREFIKQGIANWLEEDIPGN